MRMLPSSHHLRLIPQHCLPWDDNCISHPFKTKFANCLCGIKTFRTPKGQSMGKYEWNMNIIQIFFLSWVFDLLPTTPMSFRYSYLIRVSCTWRITVMHLGGSHKSSSSHSRPHNTYSISQKFTISHSWRNLSVGMNTVFFRIHIL